MKEISSAMKFTNRRIKTQFILVYVVLFGAFVLNLIDDNVSGKMANSINNIYLLVFFVLSLLVLLWRGLPFFSFDSEGEVLIFSASEPIIISKLSDVRLQVEFPKRKLESFEIRSLFLKKVLYLEIKGTSKNKTLKLNISYLNSNELKLLTRSLKGVLKNNKKELIDERSTGRKLAFG